jgi:hypothetical protein
MGHFVLVELRFLMFGGVYSAPCCTSLFVHHHISFCKYLNQQNFKKFCKKRKYCPLNGYTNILWGERCVLCGGRLYYDSLFDGGVDLESAPNFNYGEFALIKSQARLNGFKISGKEP